MNPQSTPASIARRLSARRALSSVDDTSELTSALGWFRKAYRGCNGDKTAMFFLMQVAMIKAELCRRGA